MPSPLRPRALASVLGVALCACLGPLSVAALADDAPVEDDAPVSALSTAASAAECQAPTLLQPFAGFDDARLYVLAPGGDFADPLGGGWQLSGGAALGTAVKDDGTQDSVLELPSGAVAVSPTMCVDLSYPTARMWVRRAAGDNEVKVSVVYDAGKSAHVPHGAGKVHGNKHDWTLSPDVKIHPQLAGKEDGWRRVAFVLTATGHDGVSQVDDVYVDPRMVK